MNILTADIGGTNTRLALVSRDGGRWRVDHLQHFTNADHDGFASLARRYLDGLDRRPARACLGLAGPVRGDSVRLTNLPWTLSAPALAQELGLDAVHLLNDLEALAWSLDVLADDALLTLQAGDAGAGGNRALIAAGTGLGEAGLYHDGRRWHPFASEGGHADFAPGDERGFQLQRMLAARFGHVSWERVVSGQGLVHLYECLLEMAGEGRPPWLDEADAPATVSRCALEDGDALCGEALRWFTRLYGAEAGNLALKHMALGGVYVGGGIAPKILPVLEAGGFVAGFLDKGRMRGLLEGVAVRVIVDEEAALIGLGRYGVEVGGS